MVGDDTEPQPIEVPAQAVYDEHVVKQRLAQAREAYSNARLILLLSDAGVPGTGKHGNQHREDVANTRKAVETLERALADGLPHPPDLAVVGKRLLVPVGTEMPEPA